MASRVAQEIKNLPANAKDPALFPGSGRTPGEGHGNPLQYSCLGNKKGQKRLGGYNPWCHKNWTQLSNWAHTHTPIIQLLCKGGLKMTVSTEWWLFQPPRLIWWMANPQVDTAVSIALHALTSQCIAGPHVPQSPAVSLGHEYILVNNMWVEMSKPPSLVFKTISLSGPSSLWPQWP